MIKMILLAGAGVLALSACSGSMPDSSASQEAVDPVEPSDAAPPATADAATGAAQQAPLPPLPPGTPALTPSPTQPSVTPPPLPIPPTAGGIDKTEQGARKVLVTWARALENHQYPLAWAQFINPPSSQADFTRWWQRYRTIRVSLGPGEGDAAMGSVYYTSPATLTGTTVAGEPFRLQGDVVVRRVNDVDGATPAQLRWHIGSADLKDTGPR